MARLFPYPIDMSRLLDDLPKAAARPDLMSVLRGEGFMPEVFEYSYIGISNQSACEARRQAALAKADEIGGVVFEYSYFKDAKTTRAIRDPTGIFGFSVVKDEEELRDRLSVYYVMTS